MTEELDMADGGEGTDVSLTELLESALVLAVQAMAGQAIGVVDTYDSVKDRVAITPLVPLLVAGEVIPAVKLPEVPVAWPQLGGMSLKFPLLPGSFMRLSVLGHDHSGWITNGAVGVPPTNERRFSLSDLVAVASAPSPSSSPPDPTSYDSVWGVLFGMLKVGSSAATALVALAPLVVIEMLATRAAYDLHIHGTPAGNSTVPTVLFGTDSVGNLACTKLKAL